MRDAPGRQLVDEVHELLGHLDPAREVRVDGDDHQVRAPRAVEQVVVHGLLRLLVQLCGGETGVGGSEPGVEVAAREHVVARLERDRHHPGRAGPQERQQTAHVADERQRPLGHVTGQVGVLGNAHGAEHPLDRHEPVLVKPELLLEAEQPRDRAVDAALRDPAVPDGRVNGINGLGDVRGHQQHIRPGHDGLHRGLTARKEAVDGAHVHRVREDQAREAQVAAQQVQEHGPRQRRRNPFTGNVRHRDVRRHDGAHPRSDRRAKRHELDRVHALALHADDRKLQMGVDLGVAVSGKVLARGDRSVLLEAPNERRSHLGHGFRILAERADVDDGVVGVVVYVQHGRERNVHADGQRLGGRDPAKLVRVPGISQGAEGHERREGRGPAEHDVGRRMQGAREPEAGARLQVCADQQRNLGVPLEIVELHGDVHRRAHGHDDATDALLLDPLDHPFVGVGALRSEGAQHKRHDHLADLLAEGHLVEDPLGPWSRRRRGPNQGGDRTRDGVRHSGRGLRRNCFGRGLPRRRDGRSRTSGGGRTGADRNGQERKKQDPQRARRVITTGRSGGHGGRGHEPWGSLCAGNHVVDTPGSPGRSSAEIE